jgi:peptide subunit release factor 1 (eRF1)
MVITNAAKGRGGAVGLDDTLKALHEGRIQTLVIREGYRAPGTRCKQCGYISSQTMDTCPFCNGGTESISDIVELAVRQALQTGSEVEVLHDNQVLKGFDKIGALLRY